MVINSIGVPSDLEVFHMPHVGGAVFAKSAGLSDKTGKFSFRPAKIYSLSDNCPMNLSKEYNILKTKMPSVLQIFILSCKRFQSVCQLSCISRKKTGGGDFSFIIF